MNEAREESEGGAEEVLTERQEDLNFVRKFWTDAGTQRAEKFTRETGIPHTVADGLQEIAEHDNAMIDNAEAGGTPEGQRQADILRGRHLGDNGE